MHKLARQLNYISRCFTSFLSSSRIEIQTSPTYIIHYCYTEAIAIIMDSNDSPRMLWKHPNPQSTAMYSFMEEVNKKQGLQLKVCTVMDT